MAVQCCPAGVVWGVQFTPSGDVIAAVVEPEYESAAKRLSAGDQAMAAQCSAAGVVCGVQFTPSGEVIAAVVVAE